MGAHCCNSLVQELPDSNRIVRWSDRYFKLQRGCQLTTLLMWHCRGGIQRLLDVGCRLLRHSPHHHLIKICSCFNFIMTHFHHHYKPHFMLTCSTCTVSATSDETVFKITEHLWHSPFSILHLTFIFVRGIVTAHFKALLEHYQKHSITVLPC